MCRRPLPDILESRAVSAQAVLLATREFHARRREAAEVRGTHEESRLLRAGARGHVQLHPRRPFIIARDAMLIGHGLVSSPRTLSHPDDRSPSARDADEATCRQGTATDGCRRTRAMDRALTASREHVSSEHRPTHARAMVAGSHAHRCGHQYGDSLHAAPLGSAGGAYGHRAPPRDRDADGARPTVASRRPTYRWSTSSSTRGRWI